MKKSGLHKELTQFRQRAEQLLTERGETQGVPAEDIRFLLHEIEVHALELELQNDELQRTRTDLETARARYTELFNNAPVGYFLLDEQRSIKEANLTAALQIGVDQDRLKDRPLSDFIHPESQDDFYLVCRNNWRSGENGHGEIRMLRADATAFDVRLDVATQHDASRQQPEQRVTVIDISTTKQIERRTKMFFSIAGHELRTPLTNISLALDLIISSSDELPDPIRSKLLVAHRATQRLRRLASEILDLRNAASTSLHLHPRRFDLAALIEESVDHNRPRAEDRGVLLSARTPEDPITIDADDDRIMQVISNLIDNSTRYSPPGEIVEVRLSASDGWARVEVEDHGPGIPPEFQPQVFEPFTQQIPSLEDKLHRDSAGLGLSICKSIIEQLGGEMGFDSDPGNRTVFHFNLPLSGR